MFAGVDHKKLLPQCERPKPVEETPQAYTTQEWSKFMFVISSERDALAFEFLLKTGAREREMTYLEWADLDLSPIPLSSSRPNRGSEPRPGSPEWFGWSAVWLRSWQRGMQETRRRVWCFRR